MVLGKLDMLIFETKYNTRGKKVNPSVYARHVYVLVQKTQDEDKTQYKAA